MTTAILFKKHRAGEISKEKFLYEVRRDQQLPFITNMTSYDDAIKILKNKSIVKEATAADNIHPYFLKKGVEAELLKGGEITNLAYAKAVATATKKLAKDPTAYDDLQISNSAKIEKADAKLGMTPVKGDNFIDKHNGMKKVKGFHDAKSNTKASKKENKKGNPKGVKMMKESALNEDLQTTFYDDIKDGKLEIAGMYVVDVQEDKVSIFFHLADEPLQNGQKLADIKKATATYNKETGEFSISGETKTKSPIVNDPESKKTFNYIKGKIGSGLQESLSILTEDMHPTYGMGQEVPLPEEDVKQFKSQTGIVKDIFGGTLELEIQREGEEPLIINRQVNVIDKAKELVNVKSQADDKASRDKAWSDWEERGEKTFAGIKDFPSKIDADRQKKTLGLVEKLRKALGLDKKKKDVDEALTAKTGDASHDNEVKKKIKNVKNSKSQITLMTAFEKGESIDI